MCTGSEASGPSRVGVSICDIATGQAAYAAILEALLARARSGQGCHIQLSLFDTIADYMNVPYLTRRYGGREPARLGLAHPSIAPYGVFHLRDGDIVLSIQSEREWQVFCAEVLADRAFAEDPRFNVNLRRVQNRQALDAHIQGILGARGLAEVTATLERHRIAYGQISTMGDLMRPSQRLDAAGRDACGPGRGSGAAGHRRRQARRFARRAQPGPA